MNDVILQSFQWLGGTPLGVLIRDSKWGFAIAEAIHLMGLALFGGTALVINLRLLGLGLTRQSARMLSKELGPWFAGSLITLILSGIVLASGETMKCYYNAAFRWKMLLLGLAVIVQFFAYRRSVAADLSSRVIGAAALLLWLGVGLAGRAVGLI